MHASAPLNHESHSRTAGNLRLHRTPARQSDRDGHITWAALHGAPLLTGLHPDHIADLLSRMAPRQVRRKEYVYLPYDPSEVLYIVLRGHVAVGSLDENGRELAIDILGTGDLFGAFLGRSLSGGFARAVDEVAVATIAREDFDRFMEKYPAFAFRVMTTMSDRIHALERKLRALVFDDVRTRICRLLCELHSRDGDARTGRLSVSLTHQDIASLVASSRETASLHLSELKKGGYIDYDRRRIRVLSPLRLRAAATHP